MSEGISLILYDFQGILAKLTGTKVKAWKEIAGPDSGCGLDYWYRHPTEGDVYLNLDQGWLTISLLVNDEVIYEADPRFDPEMSMFVQEKE